MVVETIDENESKFDKESVSSKTVREQVPPTTTEPTNVNDIFSFVHFFC